MSGSSIFLPKRANVVTSVYGGIQTALADGTHLITDNGGVTTMSAVITAESGVVHVALQPVAGSGAGSQLRGGSSTKLEILRNGSPIAALLGGAIVGGVVHYAQPLVVTDTGAGTGSNTYTVRATIFGGGGAGYIWTIDMSIVATEVK